MIIAGISAGSLLFKFEFGVWSLFTDYGIHERNIKKARYRCLVNDEHFGLLHSQRHKLLCKVFTFLNLSWLFAP